MDDQTSERKYTDLSTGKPHVSFSEVREWKACSYRHKLKFIDKIDLGKPGPLMDFGTACHAACEKFLKTRVMDTSVAVAAINDLWQKSCALPGYEASGIDRYTKEAIDLLADVPAWMEATFPGWEYVDAEHQLYEPIDGHPHAFKGFIDGIIKVPGKRGKLLIWLIDWKTTSWGWGIDKRSDEMVKAQLILYRNFWSKKTGTDPKDVRCGFVLLKRTAKPGQHCELVQVSAGDVTSGRSLKVLNNMVSSVKKGIAIKNRASCMFCDYKDTEWCT